MKSKELAACSMQLLYIYIYGADDELYMNIALFLQVRMAATKLHSNNIDVGLMSIAHM
jgi:hypothetical protein